MDWEDEDVVSGFRNEKEGQFRGKKGVTYVIRVMTMPQKYRVHAINDVLPPKDDGEDGVFNMNCSKDWDDSAGDESEGDWDGDCDGCEKEYDLSDRFVAGILVVGELRKGDRIKKIAPEDSPHFWDFGKDKYRSLSDIRLSLKRGKKKRPLKAVELEVTCNSGKPEVFQDLNITKRDSDHDVLTTKKHVLEWNEIGPDLVEACMTAPDKAEWKRRLKRKKPSQRKRGGEDDDSDHDDKPTRSAKKKKTSKGKKRDEDPEEGDANGSTGDEELDDLLSELE